MVPVSFRNYYLCVTESVKFIISHGFTTKFKSSIQIHNLIKTQHPLMILVIFQNQILNMIFINKI